MSVVAKKMIEFGKNKVMEVMWAAGATEVVQESRYAHLVGGAGMSRPPRFRSCRYVRAHMGCSEPVRDRRLGDADPGIREPRAYHSGPGSPHGGLLDLAGRRDPRIAGAALADQGKLFRGREDATRYLALNSSARLEDLWAEDDTLWVKAPSRRIHFEDMVARRKAELLTGASARPAFEEKDFACYTDDEIRAFAFDVRKLFLTQRAKHLAICSRCQRRLEYWSGLVENFDRAARLQEGKSEHESEG